MASSSIVYDNKSAGSVASATSLTVAHTCSSSANRVLFINVVLAASDVLTSVKYAGASATLLNKYGTSTNNGAFVYAYMLVAPATGTNNIVVTTSSASYIGVQAASYTGVAQTGTYSASSTPAYDDGDGQVTSNPINVGAGGCLLAFVYIQDGTSTISASPLQTLSSSTTYGGIGASAAYTAFNGSSVTSTINESGSDNLAIFTIALVAIATGTITVVGPPAYKVVQRSGTTGSLAISGTYTGTPTSVQATAYNLATGAQVGAFVTMTASSGNWSGTLTNIPQGGWYGVAVQFSNDFATGAVSTNKWGVGCLVGCIGGTIMAAANTSGSAVTPNALLAQYNGAWSARAAGGDALTTLGNALITALGSVPVALLPYAVSGSGADITSGVTNYWWNSQGNPSPTTGNAYNAFKAAWTAISSKLECIVFDVGQADAIAGTDPGVATQYSYTQAATDAGIAETRVIGVPLGSYTGGSSTCTDATWEVAKQRVIAQGANMTLASAMADLALSADGLTYTAAAMVTYGTRLSVAVKYALGLSTSSPRGPSFSSSCALRPSGTSPVINVTMTNHLGTNFTPASGSALTGFRVTVNGNPVAISSAVHKASTSNQITITLAASPQATDQVYLYYQYGMAPNVSAPILDNSTYLLPAMQDVGNNGGITVNAQASLAAGVLTTDGSTPAANLTGLQYAYFDQNLPSSLAAPIAKGSNASTDANGNFSISIAGTASLVGATGFLIIDNTNGSAQTAFSGYAGPVVVS